MTSEPIQRYFQKVPKTASSNLKIVRMSLRSKMLRKISILEVIYQPLVLSIYTYSYKKLVLKI